MIASVLNRDVLASNSLLGPVTMRDSSALERLVAALTKQRDKKFSADEFSRFEVELAERLREVGREALAHEMKKADVDADSVMIEGVVHRRVLRGTETYMTTMGRTPPFFRHPR